MELGKTASTSKMRYFDCIYVDARDRSDELYVSTPSSTFKTRPIKRLDPVASADKDLLASIKEKPWDLLAPDGPTTKTLAPPHVDAAPIVPVQDLPPVLAQDDVRNRFPRVYHRDKVYLDDQALGI